MQVIADALNISKNSVSQALSGKDGVSEETRQLIIQTAKRFGYTYAQPYKNKADGPLRSIALLASEYAFSQRSFFGEIYLAIERECSKHGLTMHIQPVDSTMCSELTLPPILQNESVQGILILSHISNDYINKVLETGIPTVLIDHHHPRIQTDCVLTNNRFGSFEAVQYLICLGCRSIGFVGNISFSPSYYERLQGYLWALEDAMLPVEPKWILNDIAEDAGKIIERLSGMEAQPDAWFCANDALGFLLTSSLQQLGLRIPDEISICSFDNGQLSQITIPATTTVDIDLKNYGKRALEQLLWRMNHQAEPFMEILLPTKLIVRHSTRAPQ
ncbi:LacI family transcriptional regulator [Paenibacillus taihuensis]|uniref:LacI family transcriptional regulator n=1 Tax=Paenibacillus taihuensis TaxID=1156355 RepID=A0A3D9QW18_9BACL|nr:LacI family DNA-binding transcriptional regulator [Paenibacillus taihuensis]REE69561.1 LacI family transcriptional regulator [Paenibacillus taihuensis]